MKTLSLLSLAVLFSCFSLFAEKVAAQTASRQDHLFAPKGQTKLTVAGGVPLNSTIEFAYGISEKVTIGAFAGTNFFFDFEGYGLRFRSILLSREDLRVYLEMPVILYPETRREVKPWYLVYPSVQAEKQLPSGVRLSAGAGLLLAGCVEPLLGGHKQMSEEEHAHMVAREECMFGGRGAVMGALWSTLNTGVAVPLGERVMFFQKLDVVVTGIGIGEMQARPWLWNPPVIGVTGFSYSFGR